MKAEKFEAILAHLKKIGLIPWRNKWVVLHNWSEPTLNPELNEILRISGKYGLTCSISSNFIAPWNIDPENYQHIRVCYFSLCSLKDERYKYIYGADLQTTLKNFKKFLEKRKKFNPSMIVQINWLKYQFNLDELEEAEAYFTQLVGEDVIFSGTYAFVIDLQAHLSYSRSDGRVLEGYNREETQRDIDLERMRYIQEHADKEFRCGLKEWLIITEDGHLAQCCFVTSKHKEYDLGDILTLSKKDILRLKREAPICKECEKYNIPYLLCNVDESCPDYSVGYKRLD
jgi:wyosine [tRNA(Phe)-imidazoG37] synthetase (radical SAM superfamily)